jgi:putative SOS response-associated peptidase YedK
MSLAQLLELYIIESNDQLDWQVKYNVAPSLEVPVVVQLSGGKPQVRLMRWGLIAPWSDEKMYKPITNLRSETVMNKPGFKRLLESARCIVPVDGFYEWKTEGKTKLPYRYVMNAEPIFGLAGVYAVRTLQNGKILYTFSLITTEANTLVSQIHDRMPVIIPRSKQAAWLDPKSKLSDYAVWLSPYPAAEMRSYEVSSKINSGKIDTPDLIRPRLTTSL